MQEKHIAMVIILIIFPGLIAVDPNFGSTTSEDVQTTELQDKKLLPADANKLLANTPQAFTENRGQLENNDVRFYAQGGSIWFTDDGVWFEVREEISTKSQQSTVNSPESRLMTNDWRPKTRDYKRVVLKQDFMGANQIRPVGRERLSWNSNFFYGNDSEKWSTDVPNYAEVYYENIYNGIDLRYYSNEMGLKYDFIVHPGVDYKQIKIRIEGANELVLDHNGNIIFKTQIEDIKDCDLFTYQNYEKLQHTVKSRFKLINNMEYGFEIYSDYNPTEILVIDPEIRLVYSTFLGQGALLYGITADNHGNAIVTGYTTSPAFPTTPGAYDTTYNDDYDIFITKFCQNGASLNFSTFIGGSNNDRSYDITTDILGNIYFTGSTASLDYPTTPGAFDTTHHNQPGRDVFVTKLIPNGTKLGYSTFVHGTAYNGEEGKGIVVDDKGNAFITGYTYSPDFPITAGAYDTSYSGTFDGFIFKLNWTGGALDYSTFIGGSQPDYCVEIDLDKMGNAHVIGYTFSSTDFPITGTAYDNTHNGASDIFISTLNHNGSILTYSTFLGGIYNDNPTDIKINKINNIIVTGSTNSLDFPITDNALNKTFGGVWDCFVTILSLDGNLLEYSSFIGGSKFDFSRKIAINSKNEIYIFGNTSSSDFPTTDNAFDQFYNNTDMFFLILSPDGSELLYSTFVGGSNSENYGSIAIDNFDSLYLGGNSGSPDFPTTPDAYDITINGLGGAVVMKWFTRKIHYIDSVSLKKDDILVSKVYSKYCNYTIKIDLFNTVFLTDTESVHVILSPNGANIQLSWNRTTNEFSKSNDPNDYIILESSSQAYNESWVKWSINFDVTFNWTYPDELFNDIQVYAISATLSPTWFNVSKMYSVENDLVFNGTLSVYREDYIELQEYDLVRGGEELNWTGLKVLYENTTDVYPPTEEYDVTIWNEGGLAGFDSPVIRKNFTIHTVSALVTDIDGDTHIVNLSGIPPECDKTNETFTTKIDGDNVTFLNPTPNNTTWQTISEVPVSVNITDIGGGRVNGSSVKYCYSTNNGTNWNNWETFTELESAISLEPNDVVTFPEGKNNLIKWKAKDSVGNGPVESPEYQILVDTEIVEFSNASPLATNVSATEEVKVGITITDKTSGVNASSIEYKISNNWGETWTSWVPGSGLSNEKVVNITVNVMFSNGTGNRIRWRASDIAGNGPTESMIYTIKVNTWSQKLRVKLWSPPNASIITATGVELIWRLESQNLLNVTYDVYLDTVDPPSAARRTGLMNTSLLVTGLSDEETYYWTVIPNVGIDAGWCVSGVWTFTIDTSVPVPSVTLNSPENGSIIRSPKPTLQWSLEYEGAEILSYDVYLDTDETPVEYEKCPNIYFLPQSLLEDNQTYYWKVVPWAGNVKGPESEIWSFTVNRDYTPRIELRLTVNPPYLEQLPGDVVSVQAIVYNLGELADTITLSVDVPADAGIIAVVTDPGTMDAISDGTAEFKITVTIAEDAKKGEVILTVTAVSGKAAEYDLVVEEKAELTVKIFGIEKPETDKSSTLFTFSNILFIIIIIIIILVLAIIVNNRKKRDKEKKPTKEAVTVKPGGVPTAVISVGQPLTVAQLPGSAAGNVGEQSNTSTSSIPVLASSSSAAQTPASQQIPQVARLPQLPPAQSQTTKSEADETTPVPTIANTTSTPTPAVRAPEAVPMQQQVSIREPMETDNAQPQEQDKE